MAALRPRAEFLQGSRRFPDFSLEMAGNMVEETRRLLDHLVWDNDNFMELFTADYAYFRPIWRAL